MPYTPYMCIVQCACTPLHWMSAAAANLCHTHKIPLSKVICMNDINTIYINAIRSALVSPAFKTAKSLANRKTLSNDNKRTQVVFGPAYDITCKAPTNSKKATTKTEVKYT